MKSRSRSRYAYLVTYDFPVEKIGLKKEYVWFSNSVIVKTNRAQTTSSHFSRMRRFLEKDQKLPDIRITHIQLLRRV